MIPRIGTNNSRHLPNVQTVTSNFERLLHHTPTEKSQISIVLVGGTIAPLGGISRECRINTLRSNSSFVRLQFDESIVGGKRYLGTGSTGDGIARSGVLDEEMGGADL
eukprot:CAMPEP_0196135788 /NCGR_PEP_ID=MMETSP0910-20130528/4311_1 /TAXON_ID=49265 /ORGANISM="Thalassiosira rotula, Strain GSO102" /LENGTH=107 /DNA_ID=CAMNT_0041395977 /DNA_START=28 /DNA_END=348 /DNA_ORIENTATION=+